RISALITKETRGDTASTTSVAFLITPKTSSHSPSTRVNMALVSCGKPDSRTTRTASATASDISASGELVIVGATENATIMPTTLPRLSLSVPHECLCLTPIPPASVPVSALLYPPAAFLRPRNNMRHPGKDRPIAARTDVVFLRASSAHPAQDIWAAEIPGGSLYGFRAEERSGITG